LSRRKVFLQHFGDAITGWLAGVVATVVLGLIWPVIFPAIVRVEHYYEAGPGLPLIIAMIIVIASPAAALGGLIGGALSIEGGDRGRRMISIVAAIVLSLPCAGWGYWFFTGY
jgi:hypothetical protein